MFVKSLYYNNVTIKLVKIENKLYLITCLSKKNGICEM